jgi:hypothetical protein
VKPRGTPSLAQPKVEVKPHPSGVGHEIHIEARDKKQLEWAIAQLRRKVPGGISPDIADQIRAHAVQTRARVREPISISMGFGGTDYFRGALKSCFNLLATHIDVLGSAFDPVREFILNGTGQCEDFARWPAMSEKLDLPEIGPFDHFLGIVNRDGSVEAVVRLFGGVLHSLRLADSYAGKPIHCGYLVDPTREAIPAEHRSPKFDATSVPSLVAQPPKPDSGSLATMTRNTEVVVQRSYDRETEANVKQIITEVLEPDNGKQITEQHVREIARRIAELVAK